MRVVCLTGSTGLIGGHVKCLLDEMPNIDVRVGVRLKQSDNDFVIPSIEDSTNDKGYSEFLRGCHTLILVSN